MCVLGGEAVLHSKDEGDVVLRELLRRPVSEKDLAENVVLESRADIEGRVEDGSGISKSGEADGGNGVNEVQLPLGDIEPVSAGVKGDSVICGKIAHHLVVKPLENFVLAALANDCGNEGHVGL